PHAVVPHRDTVGDRDGAELARRSARRRYALLDRLGLAHQRYVAWRRLVPAACNPDKRLMNLLARQPHRVVIGAVRRACGTLSHMPTGKPALKVGFGVHKIVPHPKCAPNRHRTYAPKRCTWKSWTPVAEKGRSRVRVTNLVNMWRKRNICCLSEKRRDFTN